MATSLREELLTAQATATAHDCKLGRFLKNSTKKTRAEFIDCLEDQGIQTKALYRWLRSKGCQISYTSVRTCRSERCWQAS